MALKKSSRTSALKLRFVVAYCLLATVSLSFGFYAVRSSQGDSFPEVKLQRVAQATRKFPLRSPSWVFNDGLGLLYRTSPVEDQNKGGYGPTMSLPMGFWLQTANGWKKKHVITAMMEDDTAVSMSVLSSANGSLDLLFQEFRHSGAWRGGGSDIRLYKVSQWIDPKPKSFYPHPFAQLPYNSKSPDIERAYQALLAQHKATAAKNGVGVYSEEDKMSGKEARVGDIISTRDMIFTKQDCTRFSAAVGPQNTIWLTGIDRNLGNTDKPQNYLWVISSKDGGKSWGVRDVLGKGNYPCLVTTKTNDLLLFYTDVPQFGWQGQWPDDAPPLPPDAKGFNWPGRGPLMMLRSTNNGKTWSKPQKVVDDKQVIQSRVCLGDDGKVWLVWVQSDPFPMDNRRTSLWLSSSADNGKTWQKPQRLTDGKTLDREPDIIWQNGKLMVAFSRAGRGINTDIWMAEVDVKK